jgi:hypothetical protein
MAASSESESRRQFLKSVASFGAAAVMPTAGAALLPPVDAAAMKARTAVQWARLQRGLDPMTMAACRKAAERLAPRAMALVAGPEWEARMYKAVADELRKAGADADLRPPLDPRCAKEEADRMRDQAASNNPTSNAVGAGLAAAGAIVATLPAVGPVTAAVLAAIAAVMILIGQLLPQTAEDQVATKGPLAAGTARDRTGEAGLRLRRLQEALVFRLERVGDCEPFGRKVS